jgi:mannitol/fructose-specific phosphotransferase system IIA component (Ntr-type)
VKPVNPSSRTPEGQPHQCPVCGKHLVIEPSQPVGDAPCPYCGCLLWFPNFTELGTFYGFRRLVIPYPSIRTKAQAINAILDRLVEAGELRAEHRQGVYAAILKREALGSTTIGGEVAVPHAKYAGVPTLIGAVAEFQGGVDFESLDGKPVHIVCLLLSPADQPDEHLRMLTAVARRLRYGS